MKLIIPQITPWPIWNDEEVKAIRTGDLIFQNFLPTQCALTLIHIFHLFATTVAFAFSSSTRFSRVGNRRLLMKRPYRNRLLWCEQDQYFFNDMPKAFDYGKQKGTCNSLFVQWHNSPFSKDSLSWLKEYLFHQYLAKNCLFGHNCLLVLFLAWAWNLGLDY